MKFIYEHVSTGALVIVVAAIFLLLFIIDRVGKSRTSKTSLWIEGTYAALTASHDENPRIGFIQRGAHSEIQKDVLAQDWGIHNLREGEAVIKDLTAPEGLHNKKLLKMAAENGIFPKDNNNAAAEKNLITQTIQEATEKFGKKAILAWDLSRAVFLTTEFYFVGYIDSEEAMNRAVKICKQIQKTFSSWQEFNESYLLGYRFWMYVNCGSIDPKVDDVRRFHLNKLSKKSDGPFQLDWNMELVKDWKIKQKYFTK